MLVRNRVKLYTSREAGQMIGRTKQTIVRWDICSEMEVALGRPRFIPAPIRINGCEWRYWTEFDLTAMEDFANKMNGNLLITTEREYEKMMA